MGEMSYFRQLIKFEYLKRYFLHNRDPLATALIYGTRGSSSACESGALHSKEHKQDIVDESSLSDLLKHPLVYAEITKNLHSQTLAALKKRLQVS
jgi:hypothetical protein